MPLTDTKITRFVSRTPFIPYSADETDKRCELILSMQAHGLKSALTILTQNRRYRNFGRT